MRPSQQETSIVASKDFGDKGKGNAAGKRGAVAGKYDAAFRGYINLTLSPGEKEGYAEFISSDVVWHVLDTQVSDGVNLSIKLDPKGDGFLASATQRRVDSVNAGLVVTARGKDPTTAWGRVLYCLAVLGRSESWEDTQPMADPDRW